MVPDESGPASNTRSARASMAATADQDPGKTGLLQHRAVQSAEEAWGKLQGGGSEEDQLKDAAPDSVPHGASESGGAQPRAGHAVPHFLSPAAACCSSSAGSAARHQHGASGALFGESECVFGPLGVSPGAAEPSSWPRNPLREDVGASCFARSGGGCFAPAAKGGTKRHGDTGLPAARKFGSRGRKREAW